MRFTRIPIIATLLAGALSLLFLLPAFGQTTNGDLERTEGRERSGDLEVGVFSTVGDAQIAKLQRTPYPAGSPTRVFYRTPDSGVTTTDATGAGITATIGQPVATGVVAGTLRSADDPAFLVRSPETVETSTPRIDIAGNYVETRNTSFAGSLYVGSRASADAGPNVQSPDYNATGAGGYNAVLISFLDEETRATPCAGTDGDNLPVAIVSNPSRNYTIRVPLFPTTTSGEDATGAADSGEYIQSFFLVADDTQSDDYLSDDDRERDGPHCSAAGAGVTEFAQIAARHGDRLTVRIASEASNISLIVDAEGPEINLISPVDGSSVKPNSLNFRFDVRDPDSGLRHDGEFTLSGDGDPSSINPDRDAVRGGEPLSEMTSSLFAGGNGKAADIQAVYWELGDRGARLEDADRSDDITDQGAWTIIGGRAGVGYSFSAQGNNFDDADNNFQLTAMDRVGNMTTSDANFETDENEPYIFRVDSEVPTVGDVRTGISYRNDDDEEIVDRSAISLEFSEPVKSGDVVASRITVIGNSVVGVIQPDGAPNVYRGQNGEDDPTACTTVEEVLEDSSDPDSAMVPNPNKCPGTDIVGVGIAETRNLVFLQLGTPLAADAKPDVSLLSGAVQDLAGNDIATVTRPSEDWIAPTLSVTVTGTKGDRPIANSDGEFVVEVTSDEDLSGRPRVIFAEIVGKDNGAGMSPRYSYSIGEGVSGQTDCNLTPQEADNAWSRSCDVGGRIDSSITGMVGVFVLAADEDNRNLAVSPVKWEAVGVEGEQGYVAAPGHQATAIPSPTSGAAVDAEELHDAGLLIEIDNVFNAAKIDVDGLDDTQTQGAQTSPDESVTPRSGDDDKKTESPNPFIHIDFTGENDEYGLGDYKDSHGTVKITEIKLNGEDIDTENNRRLSRVAKDEFSVVLRNLDVGKYTLTYTAEDDAGNEYSDGEFKFEVLQRKPYKVNVNPGWNLISLPGAPENTAIADVLADTEFLTPVLAYQNGDWLTARRTDDNGWDGSLTDIEAGYGYWVHAQTFETVETLLTEIDPASVPPTVPVARGWNLLGVIDVDQRADGDAPGTGTNADGEADNYFNSIPWKVAYSYDTQRSVWTRYTPDAGVACTDADADTATCVDEILNGNGYWVWSERPSTLVP